MIKNIIDLLSSDEWMVGDEDIDFAKGVNKMPETITELRKIIKRRKHGVLR